MGTEQALYQLLGYNFPQFYYEATLLEGEEFISFIPSGKYDETTGEYYLSFVLSVATSLGAEYARVCCEAQYKFNEPLALANIPEYFYSSSIAILYPYLRAFVSLMTTQSNNRGIILPVLNLTGLGSKLQNNTMIIEHGASNKSLSSQV